MSSMAETPGDWILVVDEEEAVRRMLHRLLNRRGYQADTAGSLEEAIEKLNAREFALVLADLNMSAGSGLELLGHMSRSHPNTAAVMVTGVDDPEIAGRALDEGAFGYVIKPFEANEIIIAIVNALKRRALEIENRRHRGRLEEMVQERTSELWTAVSQLEKAHLRIRKSQEETVYRLSLAAEFRDDETANHIQRMSRYCALLARKVDDDEDRVELIRVASIMHDVGKIGIPDSILLKPGRLTEEERAIMETHAELGHRILSGSESDLLELAAAIAVTHHERVDGSGYPNGLTGEDIRLEGRIAAIADVFDALSTDRVYRKAFPLGKAVETMREQRGNTVLLRCAAMCLPPPRPPVAAWRMPPAASAGADFRTSHDHHGVLPARYPD
jgi:putative two-component system response regulator